MLVLCAGSAYACSSKCRINWNFVKTCSKFSVDTQFKSIECCHFIHLFFHSHSLYLSVWFAKIISTWDWQFFTCTHALAAIFMIAYSLSHYLNFHHINLFNNMECKQFTDIFFSSAFNFPSSYCNDTEKKWTKKKTKHIWLFARFKVQKINHIFPTWMPLKLNCWPEEENERTTTKKWRLNQIIRTTTTLIYL